MEQKKLIRPLLVIVAALVCFSFWVMAGSERERAQLVDPTPDAISCRQLVDHGPPNNRHIKISQFWYGGSYAFLTASDSPDWDYVYVPMYPADVQQEVAGRNIRLLVRFTNLRNEEDLAKAVQAAELTGLMWDDHNIRHDIQPLLRESYPQIDFRKCRIVQVGETLPTTTRATVYYVASFVAFVVGLVTFGSLVYRYAQRKLGVTLAPQTTSAYGDAHTKKRSWFETNKPVKSRRHLVQACVFATGVSIPGGVIFYVLRMTGLLSPELSMIGMAACVITTLACGSMLVKSLGRYQEYEQEPVSRDELPCRARRHFERHTPNIEQLGFQTLGDAKMTSNVTTFVRLFLNADQRCLAMLEYALGRKAQSFISLSDDGVCHQSVDIEIGDVDPTVPWRVQVVKGSQAEVLAAHNAMCQVHERLTGASLLAIEADEIPAIFDYTHRVASWSLYKLGVQKTPPPPLEPFVSVAALKSARELRQDAKRTRYDLPA